MNKFVHLRKPGVSILILEVCPHCPHDVIRSSYISLRHCSRYKIIHTLGDIVVKQSHIILDNRRISTIIINFIIEVTWRFIILRECVSKYLCR
uniref:Alpha-mannosidase n=1 Tax=Rhizophora mucronata TaxID=61149 RepID=A0A2P2LJ38_RHIMU